MKEFIKTEPYLAFIFGLIGLMMVSITLDYGLSTKHTTFGILLEKQHQEYKTSSGIGTGMVNGKMATIITNETTPEKWKEIIRVKGLGVMSLDVNADEFYSEDTSKIRKITYRETWFMKDRFHFKVEPFNPVNPKIK